MELKYFAIKEEVEKQRVSIEYININLIIANPLIKRLPPKIFINYVKRISIIISQTVTLLKILCWNNYVIINYKSC